MAWSEISDDIFELLLPKLTPSHFKSLHLVNRRFNGLVKLHVRSLSPKHLQLYKPSSFPNVSSLDLSRSWDQVNDLSLVLLAKNYARAGGTKLRSLSLSKCHGVTNKGVAAISRYFTQLEELNLAGCRSPVPASYVGYTGVNGETLQGLTRLQKLRLRWNPVSDASFHSITHLKHLTHLDLGWCHGMTESGIALLKCFERMEELNLERTMINQRSIPALAVLPFLQSLSLRNCSEIDDLCIIDLTQLHQLTFLDLGQLNEITDDGVRYLVKLKKLRGLDLAYSTRLTGAWVEGIDAAGDVWQLRQLKLEDCLNWVTDEILQRIAAKMRQLSNLVLENCGRIDKPGMLPLQGCPLTSLDLSLCPKIADKALLVLSAMQHLTHLNLEFCAQVSDDGIQALQKLKLLESLILNYCTNLTYAGLRTLQPLRSRLRRLEIAACHGIQTDALFFISNWFFLLEVFNVSWLPVNDTQLRSLKVLKYLARIDVGGCHELSQHVLKEFWFLDIRFGSQMQE